MKVTYAVLLLPLALTACFTHKKVSIYPHNPADTLHYEQQYCSVVNLPDTFMMRIIDHCPASAGCGAVATAANCVGLYNGDTIRVIDMCNTDTSYHPGQTVRVTADQRPSSYLSVANCYLYSQGQQVFFPFQVRLKTTYGSIHHSGLQ